jgi:DNA-binding MarR family transcriptional regulator
MGSSNLSSEPLSREALTARLLDLQRELSTLTIFFHTLIGKKLGLNTTDHKALDIIYRKGGVTAGELAKETGLTTGAVTGIVDRLWKAGFVERCKEPNDRRKVIVRALPEGEERIGPLFTPLSEAISETLSEYSEEELAVIAGFAARSIEVMKRVISNFWS